MGGRAAGYQQADVTLCEGYRQARFYLGSRVSNTLRSKKLGDILAVIRELRAVLPAQQEHEGLPLIQVNVVAGGPVVPYRPHEG